ncbi:hypothetical protein [Aquitalea pelogenes]|uniref:hypothetical protein n=1 Tax=Aquitalea pelogenes TaxID=1293573 RepID=UPI0035B1E3A7
MNKIEIERLILSLLSEPRSRREIENLLNDNNPAHPVTSHAIKILLNKLRNEEAIHYDMTIRKWIGTPPPNTPSIGSDEKWHDFDKIIAMLRMGQEFISEIKPEDIPENKRGDLHDLLPDLIKISTEKFTSLIIDVDYKKNSISNSSIYKKLSTAGLTGIELSIKFTIFDTLFKKAKSIANSFWLPQGLPFYKALLIFLGSLAEVFNASEALKEIIEFTKLGVEV